MPWELWTFVLYLIVPNIVHHHHQQLIAFNTCNTCNWSKISLGYTHPNTFDDAYSMTSLGFSIPRLKNSYGYIVRWCSYVHTWRATQYTIVAFVDALAVAPRCVRELQWMFYTIVRMKKPDQKIAKIKNSIISLRYYLLQIYDENVGYVKLGQWKQNW